MDAERIYFEAFISSRNFKWVGEDAFTNRSNSTALESMCVDERKVERTKFCGGPLIDKYAVLSDISLLQKK